MKVCVIGSGLGGLLAACSFAKKGYKVDVYEKLPYPGGRFTNIDYKGYQLSTGALHMIPYSGNGPLGTMLKKLDADVEIVDSKPQVLFNIEGENLTMGEIAKVFPLRYKVGLLKLLAKLKLNKGDKESFAWWVKKQVNSELALKIADAFTGWSLSLDASEVSSKEVLKEIKNFYKYGGPGVPMGGCRGVTRALLEVLSAEGGKLHLKNSVERIYGDKHAEGVIVEGEKKNYDLIVSNIGLKATASLAGELFPENYKKSIMNIKSSLGIKISVASDKPMLDFSGVLLTPYAERIHGINEVTNVSPVLAPQGKHLIMSHQILKPDRNVKLEIEKGIKDLKKLFPDFDKHCKILATQVHRKNWPVNRVPSGKVISPRTPVRNIVNVGDAIKPLGMIETDGIAGGVKEAINYVEREFS